MTGQTLLDQNRRAVQLGSVLASGAEGTVFNVTSDPESVAKLYDKKSVAAERESKLPAMIGIIPKQFHNVIAWPTTPLYEPRSNQFRGFLMPRMKNFKEIHILFSPANRKFQFPTADWRFLIHTSKNLAAAMHKLHQFGVVMGDVSDRNVVVLQQALVGLIDCDSYQVAVNGKFFDCGVGTEDFLPSELQSRGSLRGVVRTPDQDHFALAVLVFLLLFMNRHPFAGRYRGPDEMPIKRAIAENRFAYGRAAQRFLMEVPIHSPTLSLVPQRVASLFERAFAPEAATTSRRPTAEEWTLGLEELLRALKDCSFPGHVYSSHLSACPWCALMAHGAPNFFISVAYSHLVANKSGTQFDLSVVWARIEQVRRPNLVYSRPAPQAKPRPNPWPIGVAQHLTPMPLPPSVLRSPPSGPGVPPKPAAPTILTNPPKPPGIEAGLPTHAWVRVNRNSGQVTMGISAACGGGLFLVLLFLGAIFGIAGSTTTGSMVAWFSVAPFVVFVLFGFAWIIQENQRKDLQRQRNREYDAELLELQAQAIRRKELWENELVKRQKAAREQYQKLLKRWEQEVARIQSHAQQGYDVEVSSWRSTSDSIKQEAQRRRQAVQKAQSLVESVERKWLASAKKFGDDFDAKKAHFTKLRERHVELRRRQDSELKQLQSKGYEIQRDQFLQKYLIAQHEIPGIGHGRTATLASYGVETAVDVDEATVLEVPGFGQVLTERLVQWRRMVESGFKFDPAIGLPLQRLQDLDLKYSQERRQIEMALLSAEPELSAIANNANGELKRMMAQQSEALRELAQAQSDAELIPKGA